MKEVFIDSDHKVITSCPQCANQHYLYIIKGNGIQEGLITQWCGNCDKPYLIQLDTKLTAHIAYWKCEEVKEKK